MISAGDNFQAYKERGMVDNIYSVSGPFITVRLKLTEEMFGTKSSDSSF
jgi:hypothetical protein